MRRTYAQYCPLAKALDVVGERWTLLVVRELLLGPKRYSDLLRSLPGIGTNLLADRLRHLERSGIAARARLDPPAGSTVYELTERGRALEPAVLALARFGLEEMGAPGRDERFDPAWGVLSLQATFRPERARGVRETYEFRIDDAVFHVAVEDGSVSARSGPAPHADLVLRAPARDFLALGSRAATPEQALASGRVTVEGSPEALRRSIEILGLPAPG